MRHHTAFDDFFLAFNDFLPALSAREERRAAPSWRPAVESFLKDDSYRLRMELPGVDPAEVEVSVEGNRLTISGEKKAAGEVAGENLYFRESRYGRFQRVFRLPDGVGGDGIQAAYHNGVLELTIPVPESVKPRSVKIEVATDPKKIPAA